MFYATHIKWFRWHWCKLFCVFDKNVLSFLAVFIKCEHKQNSKFNSFSIYWWRFPKNAIYFLSLYLQSISCITIFPAYAVFFSASVACPNIYSWKWLDWVVVNLTVGRQLLKYRLITHVAVSSPIWARSFLDSHYDNVKQEINKVQNFYDGSLYFNENIV